MSTIEIIVLGKPQYDAQTNTSKATLAVTFEENVDVDNLYLEVKTESQIQKIAGEIKDAVDVSHVGDILSARHIHFCIENLIPGEMFSYQIKTDDGTIILEKTNQHQGKNNQYTEILVEHDATVLRAPPNENFNGIVRLRFGSDQEILDMIQSIRADDRIAKWLGLKLDQSEITKRIYEIISESGGDIFIHGGDLMFGENFVPMRKVTALEDFRKHISLDFHQIVRMCLRGIYSVRGLDDHDLGTDNASKAMYDSNPTAFDNAINAFNEFFPVPAVDADNGRGLFFNFRFGMLEVWVLNNRFYHEKGQSLLGDEQFKWLKDTLMSSEASMKCVVAPLPLVMGKNPKEDHRGHAGAWLDLVNLLFDNKVNIVLSADVHARSRTDLVREINGTKETMVHLINGIFGGRPQAISKNERKQLPLPLLPSGLSKEEQALFKESRVRSYYTPLKRPSDLTTLFGDMPFLPMGKKKRRAFNENGWVGEDYASGQFGLEAIDFNLAENELDIVFIPVGKESNKKIFKDNASYNFSSEEKQEKIDEQMFFAKEMYVPYKKMTGDKKEKSNLDSDVSLTANEVEEQLSKKITI